MAPRRQIAVRLALILVPVALLGCGSEEEPRELVGEPFSVDETRDLTENLAEVDELVTEGDCDGAKDKVGAIVAATDDFPPERDESLKADLVTLLGDLDQQIDDECVEGGEPTEPTSTTSSDDSEETETTTSDSVPEETTNSSTEEEPEDETEEDPTTSPEDEDEPTTPEPEPEPEPEPAPDDDTGGVGPSGPAGFEADRSATRGGGR